MGTKKGQLRKTSRRAYERKRAYRRMKEGKRPKDSGPNLFEALFPNAKKGKKWSDFITPKGK